MTIKGDFINKWVPREAYLNHYDRIFRTSPTIETWLEEISQAVDKMTPEEIMQRIEANREHAPQYAALERIILGDKNGEQQDAVTAGNRTEEPRDADQRLQHQDRADER